MNFETVLPHIKAGEKAVRQGWSGAEKYIRLHSIEAIDDAQMTPFFIIMVEGEGYSMFQPTVCDILAQDWELVE